MRCLRATKELNASHFVVAAETFESILLTAGETDIVSRPATMTAGVATQAVRPQVRWQWL